MIQLARTTPPLPSEIDWGRPLDRSHRLARNLVSCYMPAASPGWKMRDLCNETQVAPNGAAPAEVFDGTWGRAYDLGGNAGEYYSAGDDSRWDFGTGDFTIRTVCRPDSFGASGVMPISKGADGVLAGYYYYFPSSGKISASISQGALVYWNFDTSTGIVTLGEWIDVALVRTASTVKIFVNGLERSVSGSGTGGSPSGVGDVSSTCPMRIGSYNTELGGEANYVNFQGPIALVQGWNVALSASDIWQLYQPQTRWEMFRRRARSWAAKAGGGAGDPAALDWIGQTPTRKAQAWEVAAY